MYVLRKRPPSKPEHLATGAEAAGEAALDLGRESIRKILLVRPSFRMGNSILATPAIFLFRHNFPDARIDFVGGPVAQILFRNLPIDHQYQVTRRFPRVSWAYFALVSKIRSVGYDLAVELSGSQSAVGSLIVGLSGSRYRVGMRGKRDRWYNWKLPKPKSRNKYELFPALAQSMGLSGGPVFPRLVLSAAERDEALRKSRSLTADGDTPDVGVFVGGRRRKRKRWPKENFLELIKELRGRGLKIVIFVGPEEEDLISYFRSGLSGQVPVIYERSLRLFAAMVSTCKLFVAGDSGPAHLACALSVRTVVIFQKANFEHWGPPPHLARIVHESGDFSPGRVLDDCLLELRSRSDNRC